MRALWRYPHRLAAGMAVAAAVFIVTAFCLTLPVRAVGSGKVSAGPLPGYESVAAQNDANTLSYRLNPAPVFVKGGEAGDFCLENPAANLYPIQMDVELEDGTLAASSPVLPPDSHVESIPLLAALPAGVHEAEARIFVLDPDSGEILGYVSCPVTLTVQTDD